MPHLHTEPGHHDVTVSAFIVRLPGDERADGQDEPLVLVHWHRKLNSLLQPGGHIELDETPWAALVREIQEEAGYLPEQLAVLQPRLTPLDISHSVVHPVPFTIGTHAIPGNHFHSDLAYALVTSDEPARKPAEGESGDLRWLTLTQLADSVSRGEVFPDVAQNYEAICREALSSWHAIPVTTFSTADPDAR